MVLFLAAIAFYLWFRWDTAPLPFPPEVRHLDDKRCMRIAQRIFDKIARHYEAGGHRSDYSQAVGARPIDARAAMILVMLQRERDGQATPEMLGAAAAIYSDLPGHRLNASPVLDSVGEDNEEAAIQMLLRLGSSRADEFRSIFVIRRAEMRIAQKA